MTHLLEVDHLTTAFRAGRSDVTAIRDVSFSIEPGRILGLVGESGSGKSVTVRSVMGLLSARGRVSGGSVTLEDRDVLAMSEAEKREMRGLDVAMVFQDPQSALNPMMRVGDQIVEALEVHGTTGKAARDRAVELLGQVGIPDPTLAMRTYPHQFSGGMRQRVVIAIALANKPKLLIADEPTTALDVTIQAQILELLGNLRRDLGVAIVLITHDMGVVAELCDDLVVMYGGRVVERGSVAEVFDNPRHPYTAALLNAVPRHEGRDDALKAIPGSPPVPGDLPSGCAFHPRCAFCQPACKSAQPPLIETSPGHEAACIIAREERDLAPPQVVRVAPTRRAAPASEPILRVTGLRTDVNADAAGLFRKHKPVFAVDGVSFEVHAGRTFGLVGESGCGKSTLSRTLVGINQATEGRIEVAGRDVTAMTDQDRHHVARTIQYVFQDPSAALNPRRTIGQSMAEALAMVGLSGAEADRRAAALMDQVGLSPAHLGRYPHEMSGGQKQRVGIARALSVEPKMLICDEPVSALDVSIQAQIINLLAELRDELNIGILFIAHDLSVVRHVSDDLAVMYLGRFVETGDADEIYSQPRHPYTAALLSAIPVADVSQKGRTRTLLGGDIPSPARPPSGCRFRTRCPEGPLVRPERDICLSSSPELAEAGPGHCSACHFRDAPARGATRGTAA